MDSLLYGVHAPALTPFDARLNPDPDRYLDHCRRLLDAGCHGLLCFGTTGEAASLSVAERQLLLEQLTGHGGIDPARLLVGVGCCALFDTVALAAHATALGCRGVLLLPPFYYKRVDDRGLAHWVAEVIRRVADARLRVLLYHIPQVAGVGWSADLVRRLARTHQGVVVGLKDSGDDRSYTRQVLAQSPGLALFVGSEIGLRTHLQQGGAGAITATANVNAPALRRLHDQFQDPSAEALQQRATRLRQALQALPMIAALKHLLARSLDDDGWRHLRPPLTPLSPEQAARCQTLPLDSPPA
jgi:4-hydroxy-tetrahydrodipicolinate synthase